MVLFMRKILLFFLAVSSATRYEVSRERLDAITASKQSLDSILGKKDKTIKSEISPEKLFPHLTEEEFMASGTHGIKGSPKFNRLKSENPSRDSQKLKMKAPFSSKDGWNDIKSPKDSSFLRDGQKLTKFQEGSSFLKGDEKPASPQQYTSSRSNLPNIGKLHISSQSQLGKAQLKQVSHGSKSTQHHRKPDSFNSTFTQRQPHHVSHAPAHPHLKPTSQSSEFARQHRKLDAYDSTVTQGQPHNMSHPYVPTHPHLKPVSQSTEFARQHRKLDAYDSTVTQGQPHNMSHPYVPAHPHLKPVSQSLELARRHQKPDIFNSTVSPQQLNRVRQMPGQQLQNQVSGDPATPRQHQTQVHVSSQTANIVDISKNHLREKFTPLHRIGTPFVDERLFDCCLPSKSHATSSRTMDEDTRKKKHSLAK